MDAVSVFNNITNQYQQAIAPMTLITVGLARDTFTKLALITVAVALINHLLRTQVDAAEANVELFKTMLTLYFFFMLIQSYPQWLPLIGKTFKSVGINLAGLGANYAQNVGGIVALGLNIGMKMLSLGFKLSGWTNLGLTLIAIGCSGVVIYCFVRIAIEVLLVDIGSRIILGVGVFMLGFAGAPWTRPYAEKYISTMFNLGIKMLFIYVLVGVGSNISNNWIHDMVQGGHGHYLENIIGIATATYVYFMICLKVPEQAASMLSGMTAPGFGSGDANIRSVMAGGALVAAGAVGAAVGSVGGFKAVSAAWQAASRSSATESSPESNDSGGKKALTMVSRGVATTVGAVKTLGEATASRAKEKLTNVVNNTTGGRIAKRVSELEHMNRIRKAEQKDSGHNVVPPGVPK